MADIFDELQEDIEQERWTRLWKKYHNYIYGVVGGVLIATAGYSWYNHYNQSKLSQAAEQYFRGINSAMHQSANSLPIFNRIAEEYNNIYTTLSRFWAAALLGKQGQDEMAATVYEETISDNSGLIAYWKNPQSLMKELAIFKKAYLTIDQADPETLRKLITPFAQEDNPWKLSAYEILALLQIRENHLAEAKEYLEKIITDKSASAPIKQRAEVLLGTLDQQQSAGK